MVVWEWLCARHMAVARTLETACTHLSRAGSRKRGLEAVEAGQAVSLRACSPQTTFHLKNLKSCSPQTDSHLQKVPRSLQQHATSWRLIIQTPEP